MMFLYLSMHDTKLLMDNAYPELKSKTNLISINNDRDGVIETLNILLINDDNHSECNNM